MNTRVWYYVSPSLEAKEVGPDIHFSKMIKHLSVNRVNAKIYL